MSHRCEVCEHFEQHGVYPDRILWHCDDGCHASGKGQAEIHCAGINGSGCHRTFGGEAAFTAHQTEDGCRDPITLKTRAKERRFKTVMRGDLMVWVKNDLSGTERYRKRRKEPAAARVQGSRYVTSVRRYEHRRKGAA